MKQLQMEKPYGAYITHSTFESIDLLNKYCILSNWRKM